MFTCGLAFSVFSIAVACFSPVISLYFSVGISCVQVQSWPLNHPVYTYSYVFKYLHIIPYTLCGCVKMNGGSTGCSLKVKTGFRKILSHYLSNTYYKWIFGLDNFINTL